MNVGLITRNVRHKVRRTGYGFLYAGLISALSLLASAGTATAQACSNETVLLSYTFDASNEGWTSTQTQNGPVHTTAAQNNVGNANGTVTDATVEPSLNGGLGVSSPQGGEFVSAIDSAGGTPTWQSPVGSVDASLAIGGRFGYERFNWANSVTGTPFYLTNTQAAVIVGTSGRLVLDIDDGPVNSQLATGAWVSIERVLSPSAEWYYVPSTNLGNNSGKVLATAANFASVLGSVTSVGVTMESISVRDFGGTGAASAQNAERYALDNVVLRACPTSIDANDDAATTSATVTAQTGVVDIFADNGNGTDTLGGSVTDETAVTVSVATGSSVPTGLTFNTSDGTVDVDAGTAPGIYSFDYQICETANPANCTTATVTVTVTAATDITANDDGPVSLNGTDGETSSLSVLSNDTLGGVAITDPALVTLTTVSNPASGSITLNPDGTVTVAPGTAAGTYTLEYEICEVANPTNCEMAEVEIVVLGGADLVSEVADELTAMLQEDLANTLIQQSNQISGYSADALDVLRGRGQDQCLAAVNARLRAENIRFDTDKAIIKPESQRILDELALILSGCSGGAFEIAGHTDSDASDAYNIDLSQRRVEAVLRALTARGVDTSGYIARGYGESQPIASNATEAGKAQNRRVEFRAINAVDTALGPCDDSFDLMRAFNLHGDENGLTADGEFRSDQYDCYRDRRDVIEGSLAFSRTSDAMEQTAINLSYRREHYSGSNSVAGYFVGLYASQSDVANTATGEISGLGVNSGIYGAKHLRDALYVDYYLGGAAGRHSFDLAFDRDIGTVSATGDYTYLAAFAGTAISGEMELGDTTLTPRIGVDYVYTPGGDVDVLAELGALSDAGNLELDAISGGRAFLELWTDHLINDGQANLWLNPRIACYQSLGNLDGVCGYGFSLGAESAAEDSERSYAFEIDSEWGEDYFLGTLSAHASRDLRVGYINGDVGLHTDGNATVRTSYEVQF